MRSVMIGGAAVACLLGLSACGNNNSKTEAPAGEGAKNVPGSVEAALDAPRPGLWRVTTVMEGAPGGATIPPQEVCVTEAKLEPPANAQQPGAEQRQRRRLRHGGDGHAVQQGDGRAAVWRANG